MKKPSLSETMKSRSPLAKREAITPVNLYEQPVEDNIQSPPVDMSTSGHVDKSASQQENKSTSGQGKRYTTYLRPDTIKAIKREAFDSERNVYDIVQDALDAYFAAKESGRAGQ